MNQKFMLRDSMPLSITQSPNISQTTNSFVARSKAASLCGEASQGDSADRESKNERDNFDENSHPRLVPHTYSTSANKR